MAYGPRVLFRHVSFTLAPGDFLIVTGRNGAGKSSLLKVLAGLSRPIAGVIRYPSDTGKLTNSDPANELPIGYCGPDINIYDELSAAENLNFFGGLRGLTSVPVNDLISQFGLDPKRSSEPVSAFSTGMRQRLKLALSLVGSPIVLIWDEPTATLDSNGRQLAEDVISSHTSKGGIFIVATNVDDEAERWGTKKLRIGT
jgi:heme exporter protein A